MQLSPGARLGAYEVVSPIGSGGMGEIYRARDTTARARRGGQDPPRKLRPGPRAPTISPDGKTVVFVSNVRGNSDLYLLRIGGRKAIPLTEDSPEDDCAPAFSPDGTGIAFRSERAGGGGDHCGLRIADCGLN